MLLDVEPHIHTDHLNITADNTMSDWEIYLLNNI